MEYVLWDVIVPLSMGIIIGLLIIRVMVWKKRCLDTLSEIAAPSIESYERVRERAEKLGLVITVENNGVFSCNKFGISDINNFKFLAGSTNEAHAFLSGYTKKDEVRARLEEQSKFDPREQEVY